MKKKETNNKTNNNNKNKNININIKMKNPLLNSIMKNYKSIIDINKSIEFIRYQRKSNHHLKIKIVIQQNID